MRPLKILNHSTTIKRWLYRLYWLLVPERFKPQSKVRLALRALGRNMAFINIGANDGLSGNPLAEFIFTRGWCGLMVEPVDYLWRRCVDNHSENGVEFAQGVVSKHNFAREFFFIEQGNHVSGYDQIGSLNYENVRQEADRMGINRFYIKSKSIRSANSDVYGLLAKNPEVIVIDTQGADGEIMELILEYMRNHSYRPRVIVFEHEFLIPAQLLPITHELHMLGYELATEHGDTIAIKKQGTIHEN